MNVTIGGTQVRVSFWFLAVLTLFAMLDRSFITLSLLAVVALHEGVHLIALCLLGAKIRFAELRVYGIRLDCTLHSLTPGRQAAVYLSAPIFNLLLGGAVALFDPISMLGAMSVCIGLFNLLPVRPLDGGNALSLYWTPRFERLLRWLFLLPLFGAAGCLLLWQGNISLLACVVYLAVVARRKSLE